MKKKVLGLSVVLGSALLTSCTDPSDDNSALLQNNIITFSDDISESVGINQADIPGFENNNGQNPTQVTTTFSGGADSAKAAGCFLFDAAQSPVLSGLSATIASLPIAVGTLDSYLAGLNCIGSPGTGTYTADVNISFTAGGKNYTANTTLSVTT